MRDSIHRDLLSKFDRDRDGRLDKKEIRSSMYYYLVKRYSQFFDTNHNGRVDREEFKGISSFLESLGNRR
ncbi:MAG: EF-hand domain-containing protein [Planctomycetes bacterium]|nr:EF-hand domain-containing protein [Planctomycetota bacterium]